MDPLSAPGLRWARRGWAEVAARPALGRKLRYLVSGGTSVCVEYGSFLVLLYGLGWPLRLSLGISFVLALGLSFALNHLWTFERQGDFVSRRFVAYAALALVNLGFNLLAVPALRHEGVPPAVGKVVAQCCVVAWNYLLMSRFIFRASASPADSVSGLSPGR